MNKSKGRVFVFRLRMKHATKVIHKPFLWHERTVAVHSFTPVAKYVLVLIIDHFQYLRIFRCDEWHSIRHWQFPTCDIRGTPLAISLSIIWLIANTMSSFTDSLPPSSSHLRPSVGHLEWLEAHRTHNLNQTNAFKLEECNRRAEKEYYLSLPTHHVRFSPFHRHRRHRRRRHPIIQLSERTQSAHEHVSYLSLSDSISTLHFVCALSYRSRKVDATVHGNAFKVNEKE